MRNRASRLLPALLAAAVACTRQPNAVFTQHVAERMNAAAKDAEVVVVAPLQIAVTPKNGKRTTVDLTDLWKSCGQKVDCAEPVERYVGSVVARALVARAPAAREYLRPVLRVRSSLPAAEQAAAEAFVGELVVAYVLDAGHAPRPVEPQDLQAMGLDKAGLRAAALASLEAALPEIPFGDSEDSPRVFVVTTGDDYAASRLLLHKKWEPLKGNVAGDLIAVAPSPRYVFFTGSGEDKAARDRMLAMAADQRSGPDKYPAAVLKWTPEGWVPFAG